MKLQILNTTASAKNVHPRYLTRLNYILVHQALWFCVTVQIYEPIDIVSKRKSHCTVQVKMYTSENVLTKLSPVDEKLFVIYPSAKNLLLSVSHL